MGNLLELAMEISLTSLGSSHTLFLPQPRTDAANRFCSFNDTIAKVCVLVLLCYGCRLPNCDKPDDDDVDAVDTTKHTLDQGESGGCRLCAGAIKIVRIAVRRQGAADRRPPDGKQKINRDVCFGVENCTTCTEGISVSGGGCTTTVVSVTKDFTVHGAVGV